MIVSQRPSEVSETIFAQCSNFISLRLTNSKDQAYVANLSPNNARSITDVLPSLDQGQCVVVGDAAVIPAVVNMPLPDPKPLSDSVFVYQEWQRAWRDVTFSTVVRRWQKDIMG
jgi:DNA helicase HerA-like ATPase